MKSRKSYCTTPSIGVGVGGGVSKKFSVKDFYLMGKALSGELSCPCDRSCFILLHMAEFQPVSVVRCKPLCKCQV